MPDILFWLSMLSTVGMVVIPLSHKTKGAAVWGWLTQLLASGMFTAIRMQLYPDWQKPEWSMTLIWALISWAILIIGFVIAIRKPRKKRNPVA
jgi:hypothetical protein